VRKTLLGLFCLPIWAGAADFQAGIGRIEITPKTDIWMSGYASRIKPSEGVMHELWAKALALSDGKTRVVIVTTDLIGLPRVMTDVVSARVQKKYGLERSRLMFNSSHTHTGPVVRANLSAMYDLDAEQQRRINEYSDQLTDALFNVIAAALGDLRPASVAIAHGKTGFALNRRENTAKGVKIGENPKGPVDHDVPVLRVSGADGTLRAVLFGYACHNTTLTGEFYQISGDYAGFAQAEIEKAHPGATALFMELCAGDQNPYPRSTVEYVVQHGKSLAAEVGRVLKTGMRAVKTPVRSAFRATELEFAPHTREKFEEELKGSNKYAVRRAQLMLKAYEEGRPIRRTPYPVQAIRLGNEVTLLALGGEVVVDYAVRAKSEFGTAESLIVAGYSNDVMCYIPSLRVLKEGGYEADSSMIYYGQPGPFNEQVEEMVFDAIYSVMKRVGRAKR
jgi:hypothetical protein